MPMYINTIYTITTKEVKSISYMLVAPITIVIPAMSISNSIYILLCCYRLQARYYYPWKLAAYVAYKLHSIAWGYHDTCSFV